MESTVTMPKCFAVINKRVSRLWRYSITWRYILMAIVNYSTHFLVLVALHEITSSNNFSIIVQTTVTTVIGFCFLVYTSSRLRIAFRFSILINKAIRHMRKAEIALADEYFNYKGNLNLRVVVGSSGIILWVNLTYQKYHKVTNTDTFT